jgi:glc operon protein GlcG
VSGRLWCIDAARNLVTVRSHCILTCEDKTMRSRPALTFADAEKMMAACKAEAQKNNWKVAIAIVDDAGYGLLLERMDGCGPISAEVAMGKARTSALSRRPTKFWEERVKERPAFVNFPAGLLIQGGLPLIHQGECVGAIGVSGVQSHEDEQIAQAGVSALA